MKSGRNGLLLAALLLLVAVALGLTRSEPPHTASPVQRPVSPPARVPPATVAVDPGTVRDVFRFAEGPDPYAQSNRERPPIELARAPGVTRPAAGPRLVGLVRRGGRLWAALVADGTVEIAGPGQSAGGVTVVSVDEDGVRIRRGDGQESVLTLPE